VTQYQTCVQILWQSVKGCLRYIVLKKEVLWKNISRSLAGADK